MENEVQSSSSSSLLHVVMARTKKTKKFPSTTNNTHNSNDNNNLLSNSDRFSRNNNKFNSINLIKMRGINPPPRILTILFFFLILATSISFVSMYEPGCSKPLGLMTGEIEDWQLSASSVKPKDVSCAVKYARLHQPGSQAWCAHSRDLGESHWILVDLGVTTKVSGLLTQGRGDELEWVTAFTLAYSDDAYKWDFLHDFYGKKKMFRGNSDSHGIVTHTLNSPVNARFVRIHVLEWNRHPSLRLEILGCQDCASLVSGPGIGSGLTASSFGAWARKNSCQPEDAHIHSHRAWCSRHNNPHQWLQLDVGPPTMITGIVTRGRGDTGRRQWVTSYTISYSNDTSIWYYYKETNHLNAKVFGGNMDKSTERRHYFNSPFVASFIRIHPTSWHNHIAIRAAALGCPTRECPSNFFRINPFSPCIENLAYKKEVWSNDKRHFWKDWKYGHASLAVDGHEDVLLPKCAIIDNYYAETPILMIDLGKKYDVQGVILVTWQGDGQDKKPTYRDYVLNLDRLTIFVSNKPRLDSPTVDSEPKCGSISRNNNALFHPRLRFDCTGQGGENGNSVKGRYVYIQSTPVPNRWDRIFNSIFCQVYVY